MAGGINLHSDDLRGLSQLVTDGVVGVADLTEALHAAIVRPFGISGSASPDRTGGITGTVYRSVRGVNYAVAGTLDVLLGLLGRVLEEPESSPRREAVLAALNGVLGDSLAARNNPLAIAMNLRCGGQVVPMTGEALRAAFPHPSNRVLVLVHGLCMNDLQWNRCGHDHGLSVAEALGLSPLYLHYNTGLHTSVNGRLLADLLEQLVEHWPVLVDDIVIVAHSMGGLVARSAHYYATEAGHVWPDRLGSLVFLGTPHHGAPLERGGNWIDHILGATRYSAPFARLGKVRSAGITDLRYGNLLDEDWQGSDRFERGPDNRGHLPLPDAVKCFAAAASRGDNADDLEANLVGDGLVPVNSALGRHADPGRCLAIPEDRQWVGCGVSHVDLLGKKDIAEWICKCLTL